MFRGKGREIVGWRVIGCKRLWGGSGRAVGNGLVLGAGGKDGVKFLDERERGFSAVCGVGDVIDGPVEGRDVQDFNPLTEVARERVEEQFHGRGRGEGRLVG